MTAVSLMPIRIFQFHKGTIKTDQQDELNLVFYYFNSIKVRLKLKPLAMSYDTFDDFNSIKVRLKRLAYEINMFYRKFQFHKGTIKTL